MRFVPLLIILSCGALPVMGQAPARADIKPAIDSFINSTVAADAFSGAVLVARNEQIVYQRAVGMANIDAGIPMTADTRMQIASVTKRLTQRAIRQLQQAGMLSLSDTVGKFLPKFANPLVRRNVTIEMLLHHRSGVGSFWNDRFVATRANIRTVNDYLGLFQEDSLLFVPGTRQVYSNGGYVILGAIIESITRKSYHDYIRERILVPAGMTRTAPYDRRVTQTNAALGYTRQPMSGPQGDRRLAGPGGPRPGMSPSQGTLTASQRGPRRSNADMQPGLSSPAGDHYSTVGDFLKLANALKSNRLLDSAHTAGLFGARYAAGKDMRSNGGGPGVNAELSIYPSGEFMVVLSNYDPPSATSVAEFIRSLISPAAPAAANSLKAEIEALHSEMVAAFKRSSASVARFYTDDASILGGGQRSFGRDQIDQYWSKGPMPTDWSLEVLEVGGDSQSPWVRGRSTLSSQGGRQMVTDFVGILKRQPDGRLKYYIDMYVGSGAPMTRP